MALGQLSQKHLQPKAKKYKLATNPAEYILPYFSKNMSDWQMLSIQIDRGEMDYAARVV